MRKNHRADPGRGAVTMGKFSGLRKLMRAMRRGKVPDDRMAVIMVAERAARKHVQVKRAEVGTEVTEAERAEFAKSLRVQTDSFLYGKYS